MLPVIPSVTSRTVGKLADEYFADCGCVRVPAQLAAGPRSWKPSAGQKLWVDAGVEKLHRQEAHKVEEWLRMVPGCDDLLDPHFIAKPNARKVEEFVRDLLTRCNESQPTWLSVPQLPAVENSARNKVNKILAEAAQKWKDNSQFTGQFVLPVIISHPSQIRTKTARKAKAVVAKHCFSHSDASVLWTVDSSFNDEKGNAAARQQRIGGLIDWQEEINEAIEPAWRVAGPYWAAHLVLWARDLVDAPLIGVGSGFQLPLSRVVVQENVIRKSKAPLPSLRRRIVVDEALASWLDSAVRRLGQGHDAAQEFAKLAEWIRKNKISDGSKQKFLKVFDEACRRATAKFYRQWIDTIKNVPAAGRPIALFQDTSQAYSLGKGLPPFASEAGANPAASIAEALMLNCL